MFVSVSSRKISQGLGHSDILDHPHGENHLNSLRSGRQESFFVFLIVSILCRDPLVSFNGLTFWGMVL